MQQQCRLNRVELKDLSSVILKRKFTIILIVFVTVVTSVFVSLFLPISYQAETVIMPISTQRGTSSFLSQLGGLASVMGLGNVSAGTSPLDQFMVLLKSKTLARKIIEKNNLMPVIFASEWDEEKKSWKNNDPTQQPKIEDAVGNLREGLVRFISSKQENIIIIRAEMPTAKLAAEVANSYAEGLRNFIGMNSFTIAKRNRIYVENTLAQNKVDLLKAGKELNEFYRGGKISNIESLMDVQTSLVSSDTNVGEIFSNDNSQPLIAKNVQNSALADFEVLNKLQKQKDEIELEFKRKFIIKPDPISKNGTVVKDIPQQVYLQYLTLRRNILAQINAVLSQQYEMAKVEESKDELFFQILDEAVEPIQRFKPKRKLIVISAFMASLFLSIMWIFLLEYLDRTRKKMV